MNDLREITREPYLLERAGLVRRDEETTDVVRWVWYERTINSESEVTLVLQVEFELSISDEPYARTTDNFSYSSNGVYLKIIEGQTEAEDSKSEGKVNFLKNPHVMPLGDFIKTFGKEEPREIDRFELRVTTRAQLCSLCTMLGWKNEGVEEMNNPAISLIDPSDNPMQPLHIRGWVKAC